MANHKLAAVGGARAVFQRAFLDQVWGSPNVRYPLVEIQQQAFDVVQELNIKMSSNTISTFSRPLRQMGIVDYEQKARVGKRGAGSWEVWLTDQADKDKSLNKLMDSDWGIKFVVQHNGGVSDDEIQAIVNRLPFRITNKNKLAADEWKTVMVAFTAGKLDIRLVSPRV